MKIQDTGGAVSNAVTKTVDRNGIVVCAIDKDVFRGRVFFVLQVTLKRRAFREKPLIALPRLIRKNMVLLLECDG